MVQVGSHTSYVAQFERRPARDSFSVGTNREIRVEAHTSHFSRRDLCLLGLSSEDCQLLVFSIQQHSQHLIFDGRESAHLKAVPILTAPFTTLPVTVIVSPPTCTAVSKIPVTLSAG